VIVVDKLLAHGLGWVLRRVHDVAYGELYGESSLREELLAAEMRLELGEIDEDEFCEIEAGLFARMREARAGHVEDEARAALQPGTRYVVAAIEADTGEEPSAALPARGRRKKPAPDEERKTRRPAAAPKKKRRLRR
jgi:hypothetical protein